MSSSQGELRVSSPVTVDSIVLEEKIEKKTLISAGKINILFLF
jgi:hypothetical protein